MQLYINKIVTCYLVLTLITTQTGVFSNSNLFNLRAEEQDSCTQRLLAAEDLYYSGAFDEAIDLAKVCLKEANLSNEQQAEVFTLLAKAFMAKGESDTARKLVKNIFISNPEYHPTIEEETPKYVNLVDEVRGELQQSESQSGSKKWWWIGGGVVIAGALTAAVLLSDGDKPVVTESLPAPPAYPDN